MTKEVKEVPASLKAEFTFAVRDLEKAVNEKKLEMQKLQEALRKKNDESNQ
jgi:hypothetical protein